MAASSLTAPTRRSRQILLLGSAKLLLISTLLIRNELFQRTGDISFAQYEIIRPPESGLLQRDTPTPDPSPYPTITPTPTATKPAWWVRANENTTRVFGTASVILPAGFTNQGGASVFADFHYNSSPLELPAQMLPNTLFSLGIWPSSNQTDFQKAIELRFTLDAAAIPPGTENQLMVRMFDPATSQWRDLSSQFKPETYQLVAFVQSFTPVPDSFPSWGGRSFFGIFTTVGAQPAPPATPQPTQTTTGSTTGAPTGVTSGPTANRSANLRSGPGTTYPVVGGVQAGQLLNLVARNEAGTWYQTVNGQWIAAFLVNNVPSLPVVAAAPPPPTSTSVAPRVTPTKTPTSTPITTVEAQAIGLLTLTENQVADLDTGEIGNLQQADILYQKVGDQYFMVPINGAQLGQVASTVPDYATCAQTALSVKLVELGTLPAGTALCVRTKEGHLSHLQIWEVASADPTDLTLLYTTW